MEMKLPTKADVHADQTPLEVQINRLLSQIADVATRVGPREVEEMNAFFARGIQLLTKHKDLQAQVNFTREELEKVPWDLPF